MAKPVTHLSNIRRFADRTITGTLCNRMSCGEINCSTDAAEVTCKFCLRMMAASSTSERMRGRTTNQMIAIFRDVIEGGAA